MECRGLAPAVNLPAGANDSASRESEGCWTWLWSAPCCHHSWVPSGPSGTLLLVVSCLNPEVQP